LPGLSLLSCLTNGCRLSAVLLTFSLLSVLPLISNLLSSLSSTARPGSFMLSGLSSSRLCCPSYSLCCCAFPASAARPLSAAFSSSAASHLSLLFCFLPFSSTTWYTHSTTWLLCHF
jgi:hypothetical protein